MWPSASASRRRNIPCSSQMERSSSYMRRSSARRTVSARRSPSAVDATCSDGGPVRTNRSQPGGPIRLAGMAVATPARCMVSPGVRGNRQPYGVPTHSSVPSAKIWCFQIGMVALSRSIRAREASYAWPRWAAEAATRTAASPIAQAGRCGARRRGRSPRTPRPHPRRPRASSPARSGGRCSRGGRRPSPPSWSRTAPTNRLTPPAAGSSTAAEDLERVERRSRAGPAGVRRGGCRDGRVELTRRAYDERRRAVHRPGDRWATAGNLGA